MDTTGCISNTILTASGKYFDFVDPQPDQIHIEDIAKALGNTCRFGGHCDFYSVAEHSYKCCQVAYTLFPDNRRLKIHALMHDAAEAYIGDMMKPMKIPMFDFQALETKVEAVIREKFGLTDEFDEEVKRIDLIMLKQEKKALFPKDKMEWPGFNSIEDLPVGIECLPPQRAASYFLHLYRVCQCES